MTMDASNTYTFGPIGVNGSWSSVAISLQLLHTPVITTTHTPHAAMPCTALLSTARLPYPNIANECKPCNQQTSRVCRAPASHVPCG